MKKNWAGLRAMLLGTAAAAVLIAATACANPVSDLLSAKNWGLVGTWETTNYGMIPWNFGPGYFKKLIINADGTFRAEDNFVPPMTIRTGTYTVSSVSVTGDSRTYQILYAVTWAPNYTHYVLARITNGNSYESVYADSQFGGTTFPASVSTSGIGYLTGSLQ